MSEATTLQVAAYLAAAAMHWLCGLVVLAEGLNKLERSAPLQPGLDAKRRVLVLAKVGAWILLVLGSAGAVVRPLVVTAIGHDLEAGSVLLTDRVSIADLCLVAGFATLILRSRLKEPAQ